MKKRSAFSEAKPRTAAGEARWRMEEVQEKLRQAPSDRHAYPLGCAPVVDVSALKVGDDVEEAVVIAR